MLQPPEKEKNIDRTLIELAGPNGIVWIPKHEMSDGTRCVDCAMVLEETSQPQSTPRTCYLCT